MPILAIIGLVSLAVGAYTMVQGVQNNNKGQVLAGMLGIFGGVAGAAGAFTSAAAGAGVVGQAAAPVASTVPAAAPTANVFSTMGAPLAAGPQSASLAAPTVSSAFAPVTEAVVGAAPISSQVGGSLNAVKESGGGVLGSIGDSFKGGLSTLKDNPELTKLGGGILKAGMQSHTQNKQMDALREFEAKKAEDARKEQERRNYQSPSRAYRSQS